MAFGFRGANLLKYGTFPFFIGGCDGPADTPDPIPNSEVKRPGGDNTPRGKIAAAAFSVSNHFPARGGRGFFALVGNGNWIVTISIRSIPFGSLGFLKWKPFYI